MSGLYFIGDKNKNKLYEQAKTNCAAGGRKNLLCLKTPHTWTVPDIIIFYTSPAVLWSSSKSFNSISSTKKRV